MPLGLPVTVKGEHVSRLLDIIEIQCQEDVEQYARHLKELFATVEGKERALPVLDICVEQILNRARDSMLSPLILRFFSDAYSGPGLASLFCDCTCYICCRFGCSHWVNINGSYLCSCMRALWQDFDVPVGDHSGNCNKTQHIYP